MDVMSGIICHRRRTCPLGLLSYGKLSAVVLFTLLLGQHAAGMSFNEKLSKMLRGPSRHGMRMPKWNPDPETKLRVRRALADTTTANGDFDDNVDASLAPEEYDYDSTEDCPERLKFDLADFSYNAYKGPVCDIVDARSTADQLRDLENCTIVNGFVQLVFMHDLTEEDLRKYRFPKLRVITDYLLVFRMFNVRSLRYMFPNLAVIGGRELFKDYALVIFENPNLKEVGLGNLQFIKRGGVRIQKNPMLCYLSTVNWERLGLQGDVHNKILPNKIDVMDNREESQCVNQCGDNAGCDKDGGREFCWGLNLCQKRLCPKECPDSCHEDGTCDCHEQCLAGCTRRNDPTACVSCRDKYYNGTCLDKCPEGKYLIFDWLCIEKVECQQYDWHFFKNECRRECPPGYNSKFEDCMRMCVKCTEDCGVVCPGDVSITGVDSLDEVKLCSEIEGALTLSINGGSEVVERLDEDLRNLKQIGSLVVKRSFPLVTLSFLKNLKTITGNSMERGTYSIYILENQNLKELWNFTESGTKIKNGKAFFHFNPLLCMQEVLKVRNLTPEIEDDKDISDSTNGDKAICKFLPIVITDIQINEQPLVNIWWENFVVKDDRTLIGYQVFYKESPEKNAKKNEGVDACRLNSWTIVDKAKSDDSNTDSEKDAVYYGMENITRNDSTPEPPGRTSKLITHLEAYTQYAFYVQAYTTSTAESGAASEIQYFMTKPARPSQPRKLRSSVTTTSSIVIEWDPPLLPNGIITHYVVEWRRQEVEDLPSVRAINTCKHGYGKDITVTSPQKMPKPTDSKASSEVKTATEKECKCECEEEKIANDAKQEAQESSDFENYLQDRVFFTLTEETEVGYNTGEYLGGYGYAEAPGYDNNTRVRRSIVRRSEGSVNISAIVNSTTAHSTPYASAHTPTSATVTNGTTPVPVDRRFMQQSAVVLDGKTSITLSNLHHYSEYSIQVYACNHASNPQTRNASVSKLGEKFFSGIRIQPYGVYVPCSIEAITMKRTSPNKSADTIPPGSVKPFVQNVGTAEEMTTLYWGMPKDPNAYIRTFTIEVSSTESEKVNTFCVHVNSSIGDTMSYNFSHAPLSSGKYSARIRAISLSGEGNWTEPVEFEERDPKQTFHMEIIIATVIVAVLLIAAGIGLAFYMKTRNKPEDHHGFYTDYNPEYQRYVYNADEYEVDVEKVTLLEEIGHGNFGKVFAGIAKSVVKGEAETKVAIKKLHENALPVRRYEFLTEAHIMKAFNAHHVVRLLGVISQTPDPMVIMEFMEKGDLKSYLRSRRENVEENPQHLPSPTLQEKLQMAAEIADGMAYLATYKYVHRDLAARNCLVNGAGTVKIGDFGLTRDIYETDYYRKESRGFLPIRWMAPESLRDGIFDSRSDIWSYGVVLWELATLAEQPYQGLPHDEVTRFVIDGGYMEKPRNCPKRLYDLMTCCWQFNPKMRPIFLEIVQALYRDVNDEFKEVCFYGKSDQTSPVEEEEGQYLLEHSDGLDAINLQNFSHKGDHYPANNVLHTSSGSAGDHNNYKHHKNSVKLGQMTETPPKADLGDKWLSPDYPQPTGNIESPLTTSTTAPTTPASSGDRRTSRNRNSSESLYENDLQSNNKTRDPHLNDSGAFIFMSGPQFNGDKDPLVSYKHMNGGHKLMQDMDLDHESGVDDSSTVSPSNPPTPTENHVTMLFGGQNDETTAFLRPTASSNC